jgi:hypothetical protein
MQPRRRPFSRPPRVGAAPDGGGSDPGYPRGTTFTMDVSSSGNPGGGLRW